MCTELTTLPGGHVLVALSGEIDVLTAPAVREALTEATRRAVTGVLIDLAEVTFLDAAGLGVLAGAFGRARHLPDGLRLVAVPPYAQRRLKLTQLDRHLAVFPALSRREQPADAGPPPQPPQITRESHTTSGFPLQRPGREAASSLRAGCCHPRGHGGPA